MSRFIAVIMAGGVGQRFWPVSTAERPKQFLDLERKGRSLLQATFDRLHPLTGGAEGVFVITGTRYADIVKKQLPDLPAENLLLEPTGRDTAPAVALAALHLEARFDNPVMGLFTADHRVGNVPTFQETVRQAIALTQETDGLTTLGIQPSYPATGFGYIQAGEKVKENAYRVARFVEKPDEETAQGYIDEGNYFWNNGIFLWHTKTILREFEQHTPDLIKPLRDAFENNRVNEVFPSITKISIDYAVLEKAQNIYVIPADYDWDDLGDWLAVERHLRGDSENTVIGQHVSLDSQNNIIYSDDEGDDTTFVTIGLEDLVIVKRGNKIFISRKDRAQDIKQLLKHPALEQQS